MFDFFRDIALEISGIDSQTIKQNRANKKELEKRKKYIFSNSTKGIIYFLGVLYLIMGGLSIWAIKGSGRHIGLAVLKYVFLSIVDVSALICLALRKNKAEIIALILIVTFVVVMYSTTMIFN